MMNLSPLNFSGLVAMANTPRNELPEDHPARTSRHAIECWKCPDCYEVYDDEDEAVECCKDDGNGQHAEEGVSLCPVCASSNPDPRQASDCCLWKDYDAHTRWAMADRVEAGETWAQVLGVH